MNRKTDMTEEEYQELVRNIEEHSQYQMKPSLPKKWMTVTEMGDLLGLKKTDRYWLVHAGYILRIDCAKAEEGLKTIPNSECALNALAIDNPVEYAGLYLDGTMRIWVDAEDSLEVW